MAFTASTVYVTEIRLAGLVVLRDVIEVRFFFDICHDHHLRLSVDFCHFS